jgi:hypothetical protein
MRAVKIPRSYDSLGRVVIIGAEWRESIGACWRSIADATANPGGACGSDRASWVLFTPAVYDLGRPRGGAPGLGNADQDDLDVPTAGHAAGRAGVAPRVCSPRMPGRAGRNVRPVQRRVRAWTGVARVDRTPTGSRHRGR